MKKFKGSVIAAVACTVLFAASAPDALAQYKETEQENGVVLWEGSAEGEPAGSIVDVAIALNTEGTFAGQFDTLIAAVLAADPIVVNSLSGPGQFTVFAPTDAAFLELGLDENNVGTLGPSLLRQILFYHVVPGTWSSSVILGAVKIRTAYRGGILLQNGGVLTDNVGRNATIIATDVPADNGVIHGIDRVVLPFVP
ncbi:MAG: fasciclin domain-containing protein [Acidobacteriota bacterium]|nr:MAG: fasciclin domain-containing protein [Acidobacteriota bacterium]